VSDFTGVAAGDPSVQQLRQLTDLGRAFTYATSLDQVARLSVEHGVALLHASSALLMLADAEGLLHVRAARGIEDELVARFRAPAGDEVIRRLQGLLGVPDEAFVAVPLVVGGAVTGLLAVALRRATTNADEWLLSALADQTAVALENARLAGEVRLEMEARLRVSEGATNAKDRALATLAHDIRTPLGAIEGYCAIMEDGLYGPVSPGQREALGRVRMSGRHLVSLLDNVMDMARLNAGVATVLAEPVALHRVAQEAADIVTPAARAKLLTLELGGERDVIATGDTGRVRQVLINLLGNAVKFTPDGGVITLTVGRGTIDHRSWGELRVADTGPGIAPAERAAIFEPYYRSETTAMLPGVGLGLAISQGLVQQMGGALAVESEPGAGATFIVRLPLASAMR
jgi:signal transduction histidine kinase